MINGLFHPNISGKISGDTKVDLHIHTAGSDGTWNPPVLVQKILESGIGIFAVTDHDTTENLDETAAIARESNLLFIPGVEINTVNGQNNYHILGLGIDPETRQLQSLLEKNRDYMEDKDNESIKYLEKRFADISFNEFGGYYNNPERGGWRALNYLIDKGLCKTYKDFFHLFEEAHNPFENLIFASPAEAVAVITEAGGVPVLAHPGASIYNIRDYKAIVSYMIDTGIRGIECFHPENSSEVTEYCIGICNAHNLLITGGSDCHGEFVRSRRLCLPDIRLNQLRLS